MLLITANCHAFLKLFLFRQCIIHIISVMLYVTESLSLKYKKTITSYGIHSTKS